MTSLYTPSIIPSDLNDPQKLQSFLDRELKEIAKGMDRATTVSLEPKFVAVTKPQEGIIVYADGVSWNPGNGEGYYGYRNGVYVRLDNTADWEFISATALNNVASWSQGSLGNYRRVRISGWAVPVTNAVSGFIRTNGDSGAADYLYQNLRGRAAVANASGVAGNALYMNDTTVISNTAGYGSWFEVLFLDFNQAAIGKVVWNGGYYGSTGVQENYTGAGFRNSTTARTSVSYAFSAGNISLGYITAEGSRV